MAPHRSIPVVEASQVGEARRAAVALAQQLGYDDTDCGRVALVATELGTNLARHAQQGRLLIGTAADRAGAIEIVSLDSGPGMRDVQACLRDGYSTSGTPGTGLGAVQRLADRFGIYTLPERGTVVAACVYAAHAAQRDAGTDRSHYDIGAIATAAPGESVSGDGWAFRDVGQAAAVMVADGLGHGPDAAEASLAATASFANMHATPARTLDAAHARLKTTRGAAVAVAYLDIAASTIVFSGAGNVVGRIVSGVDDRSLLSQHGTIGLQVRSLQDVSYAWPDHAVLVLHTDGIATRWSLRDAPGLLQCAPVLIAAWLIREHTRGRDDATVVVIRRRAV